LTFIALSVSLKGICNSLKNMKFPPLFAAFICAGLMATPARLCGEPATPAATGALGPRMTFATNTYHFGKVSAGALVKYTFIVTNTGDQTLVISKVAPGCHCTTAGDWTKARQIEPGRTGEIPLQFDSGAFRGDVTKTITVTSNDKLAPVQSIYLQGTIWRAIEVTPQFAYINVLPDEPSSLKTVVHISNKSDVPVTLSDPTSANGKFKAELKTIKPGKEFELTVTAVPPLAPGNTSGTISVKTSLTNMPIINITTIAAVQPALAVSPTQIVLSPEIDRWTTNIVSITANGSKPIVLSDAMVFDHRVRVELKEITPGHAFQVVAAFPPEFRLAEGQRVELSVKSNNPEQPVIIVPIWQFHNQQGTSLPVARPKVMSQNPSSLHATGNP
jgi:hypothetical protein